MNLQVLRDYFRMHIKLIRRRKSGNWQRRWLVTCPETGFKIATCKKLKVAIIEAHRAHVQGVNQAIDCGQLLLY